MRNIVGMTETDILVRKIRIRDIGPFGMVQYLLKIVYGNVWDFPKAPGGEKKGRSIQKLKWKKKKASTNERLFSKVNYPDLIECIEFNAIFWIRQIHKSVICIISIMLVVIVFIPGKLKMKNSLQYLKESHFTCKT